ncbi:hypothetical protein [Microcystis phage Mwe-JY08]
MGEAALIAATAATGVAKGAGDIMGGRAQASAQRTKAAQRQIDAIAARTRGFQVSDAARQQLRSTFGNIDAMNAGRGTAVNAGGTNAAMFAEALERSDRARETAVANTRSEARRAMSDSQILASGAEGYELAGLLRGSMAFLDAASGLGRLRSLGGGGGGGAGSGFGPGNIY